MTHASSGSSRPTPSSRHSQRDQGPPIPFVCPFCGQETWVDRVYAGQTGDCFRCGKPITVPIVPGPSLGSPSQVWVGIPKRPALSPRMALWFGLGGLLATALSLTLLVTLILPLFKYAQQQAYHQACSANLRRIHAAMMAYQQAEGRLPPAYVADAAGKPMHSWRVLILPYLGEQGLYQEYNFSRPWDDPSNLTLLTKMPAVFACPADPDARALGETNYMVFRGKETLFPNDKPYHQPLDPDTVLATILVAEVPANGKVWLQPDDLDFNTTRFLINSQPSNDPGSHHPGGCHLLMADGTVEFFSESQGPEAIRSMALAPQ